MSHRLEGVLIIRRVFLVVYMYLDLVSIITGELNELRSGLTISSDCTCPGFSLTYECTVMGTVDGFTVWQGSAFDCAGNAIVLRHRRFTSHELILGECSRGSLLGSSLRVEDSSFYVSQLRIQNSSDVIGDSIECVHNTGTNITSIGQATVKYTTDPFAPPEEVSINLSDLGSRRLTFTWSPVAPNCPTIYYNILSSNCGNCPNATDNTSITCIDVPTGRKSFCAFALQTVVCGNITGILSNPIIISFSDDISGRESIIRDNDSVQLPRSSSNRFIAALVSAIIVAVLIVLSLIGLSASLIALKRAKNKPLPQVAYFRAKSARNNVALESKSAATDANTSRDNGNEPHSAVCHTERARNVAQYEPDTVALETNENISYALHAHGVH